MTSDSLTYSSLLYEVESDGVALLTLNRPAALNALNAELIGEMEDVVAQAAADNAVKGLVITGAGEKAFAAGADISEFVGMDPAAGLALSQRGQALLDSLESMPKPVVAAVNGFALGGGCELALACHIRVANSRAQFGLPEVSLGLIPGYGGTQRLPRLVGRGIATELILTGDRIKADRAFAIGLVNRVVDEGEVDLAREIVRTIAGRGPVAVATALKAIRAADHPQEEGQKREADLFSGLFATADFEEGVAAFLGRRPAEFKGR